MTRADKGGKSTCGLTVVLAVAIGAVVTNCAAQTDSRAIPDNQPNVEQPAADRADVSEPETMFFRLATDMLPAGGVQLSNGIVVLASDWRTLVIASIPTAFGHAQVPTCTATLVGPNVVLMAAHCVDDPFDRRRKAKLEVDGRPLELSCEMHPEYRKRPATVETPRGSEDYALCLLDDKGVPPATLAAMRFEVVDATAALNPGAPVLMTGYGCSELKLVKGALVPGKRDGKLRIGDERIDGAATGVGPKATYVTVRSPTGDEPALCPGDSGGPLFTGASSGVADVVRRVRGVNSMVRAERRNNGQHDIVSSMAATGTPVFRSWAIKWIERNEARNPVICGLNRKPGETPCRD